MKKKLIRITTVPVSLKVLLKGQHHFMAKNGFEVKGISSNEQELYDVANDEGIEVIPLDMSRQITLLKDIKALWKMWNILRKEKPVHTHTPKAGIIGMLAAKLAGVPHRLHTVAGLPLMEVVGSKRKLLDLVERITYYSATKVYTNSKGLYDFILANDFTTTEKLKVIANGSSNGINTYHFSKEEISEIQQKNLKQELGIQPDDFVLIFVGRLVVDKGINELVEAFSSIKKSNLKLLLVGTEERELDPLKAKTIAEIEQNPNIIAVGFQKDVRPYFAISDCLVFPSHREGFPNVVMQAGAMGLPSIVSDINGCNEIIIEGENGVIIPPKNVEKLQKKIVFLYENKAFYQKLKQNSREMIVSRYEQSLVWNALLEEYQNILKNTKNVSKNN